MPFATRSPVPRLASSLAVFVAMQDLTFEFLGRVIKVPPVIAFSSALVCCLASHTAIASEIPAFVFGEYRLKQTVCFNIAASPGFACEGFVYDTIAIEKKSPTLAYVGVTLMFQNAEMCHFHGVGRWDGKILNASARTYDERMCRLKISLKNDHAKVFEANDVCSEFCAYRGSLGFTRSLPRRVRGSSP